VSAPLWLADFQAQFAAVLRTPLDRSTGTLRAATIGYPPALCDNARPRGALGGDACLAVYNRQYWFRMFGVMANAFPLSARLVGHWTFNAWTMQFLSENPPRGWDVDQVADGFEAWLGHAFSAPEIPLDKNGVTLERAALLQAARVDGAWRSVFLAPAEAPYRPSPVEANVLMTSRLQLSRGVELIAEDWPLLDLRHQLAEDTGETRIPLPPRLADPCFWAMVRGPSAIGRLALQPREAQLFALLREWPLPEALARLERACPESERDGLPANAHAWLMRSVALGFWSGIVPSNQ